MKARHDALTWQIPPTQAATPSGLERSRNFPRVARSSALAGLRRDKSQPWAGGPNAVGIGNVSPIGWERWTWQALLTAGPSPRPSPIRWERENCRQRGGDWMILSSA